MNKYTFRSSATPTRKTIVCYYEKGTLLIAFGAIVLTRLNESVAKDGAYVKVQIITSLNQSKTFYDVCFESATKQAKAVLKNLFRKHDLGET